MRLSNENVLIIPFEQCHITTIYKWYHSGKYEKFFGNIPLMTLTDAGSVKNIFMIVNPVEPNQIYGMFALSNIKERHRNLELHAMICEEFQNKGYLKDATKYIIYYILNCMNMYKVVALIEESNEYAEKAARYFGFEQEGLLKHEIYFNGEFKNIKRFYLTKGVFNKKFKKELEG